MKCPIDDTDLAMADRQGIEVDYCPKCRGIWLDRGELDKIIERSAAEQAPRPDQRSGYRDDRHRDDRRHDSRPYKKKSLLGELFDF
ncbi:zf-TFIIB domain-containing protein [Mesorhizobium sp. SP-1A]|uniref:TFIIB-type zinc ribbon-containing protein n=1 Tax=Mesorhizobium sp. SP-1A TaxID=3077840 RepID=UPI0028F72F23|nr:zf-TFIIB domain-containing protein [Mesorhizobium sp. SP-1A]